MKQEIYSITGPDFVELEFQLAGTGPRLRAGILDAIFMLLIFIVPVFVMFSFDITDFLIGEPDSLIYSFQGAFLTLLILTVYWGYHIFWETFFYGQSPGKKICHIQVLADDGHLPTWKQSMIRNLIRIIDSFPGLSYLVAGVAMGIDPNGKRLGDMAAGTIVIKKKRKNSKESYALSARSITRIEKGEKAQILTLPFGSIDARTLALIDHFLKRRKKLTQNKKAELALKIAAPLYVKWGEKVDDPEKLLEAIQALADEEASQADRDEISKEKLEQWKSFEKNASILLVNKKRLRQLTPHLIESLIQSYRHIVTDLSRARSMNTDHSTIDYLNYLVILGHQLQYAHLDENKTCKTSIFFRFPEAIRKSTGPLFLSFILFFAPALIAYSAVLINPERGYDLVPDEFIDFSPARIDNIHDIPSITRPVSASKIIANNIQVTFLAFALGLTAGFGTCYILIYNGIHLGSIAAWMQLNGNSYALWGWIMPHGGTEILAIILSGSAGFVLGDALLRPSSLGIKETLKKAAETALIIEIGCMGMLLIAGLIEGFISPSSLPYSARITLLISSLIFWGFYFISSSCKKKIIPTPV